MSLGPKSLGATTSTRPRIGSSYQLMRKIGPEQRSAAPAKCKSCRTTRNGAADGSNERPLCALLPMSAHGAQLTLITQLASRLAKDGTPTLGRVG